MAVTVTLAATGKTTINLQVSEYRLAVKRIPIVNSVTSNQVQTIDMQQVTTSISLIGRIANDQTDQGANALRIAAVEWAASEPILTIPLQNAAGAVKTSVSYYVQIESLDMAQEAAWDFYNFQLSCKVGRVNQVINNTPTYN